MRSTLKSYLFVPSRESSDHFSKIVWPAYADEAIFAESQNKRNVNGYCTWKLCSFFASAFKSSKYWSLQRRRITEQ